MADRCLHCQEAVPAGARGNGTCRLTSVLYTLPHSTLGSAFKQAKSVIDRRQEGEQAKRRDDEEAEAARKRKIKEMFERL